MQRATGSVCATLAAGALLYIAMRPPTGIGHVPSPLFAFGGAALALAAAAVGLRTGLSVATRVLLGGSAALGLLATGLVVLVSPVSGAWLVLEGLAFLAFPWPADLDEKRGVPPLLPPPP